MDPGGGFAPLNLARHAFFHGGNYCIGTFKGNFSAPRRARTTPSRLAPRHRPQVSTADGGPTE